MKISEKHEQELKEFRECVDFWIVALSLTDWDIQVSMSKIKDNASVFLNTDGRKAYISLNPKREKCLTIRQLAIHEVCEILLADLAFNLHKYYSDELIEDEVHKVINRLMPILLEFKK